METKSFLIESIDLIFFKKGLRGRVGKSMGCLEIRIRVVIYTGYIDAFMVETFCFDIFDKCCLNLF